MKRQETTERVGNAEYEGEGAKHNLRNEERKRNVEYPTNERLSFNQSFANRSGIVGRFSLFGGFWSILALRDQSISMGNSPHDG